MARGLAVFRSPRVLIQLPLGFASGLPYLLSGATLGTWMTLRGVSLPTVGYFAWAALPYSLKFLWAPLLDRFRLPFLGRRRGWLLVLQLVVAAAICALGAVDPRTQLAALAALATTLAFFSASLDIVVDAYRADTLHPEERAAGSAMYILGYRVGMLLAGAVALVMSYRFGALVLDQMKQPFLVGLGFTPSEIGAVNKGVGLAAMVAGGLVAGALAAGGSGVLAAAVGWPLFFAATFVVSLPALALVGRAVRPTTAAAG